MVDVPAGPAEIGSDDGDADEKPVRRVAIAAFRIDRTEVTQAAYDRCVGAHACAARAVAPGAPEGPDLPAVGVRWRDADAYCRFAGKRLPTADEWEKAARGADGRRFPWGDAADCARANYGDFAGSGPCPDNPGRVEPVGRRPSGASPYGALDMAGNVWEWVADDLGHGLRLLKGGSCCGYFTAPRGAERLRMSGDYRDVDIGFRCAK